MVISAARTCNLCGHVTVSLSGSVYVCDLLKDAPLVGYRVQEPRAWLVGSLCAWSQQRVKLYVHASIVICAVLARNLQGLDSIIFLIYCSSTQIGAWCQGCASMWARCYSDCTRQHAVARGAPLRIYFTTITFIHQWNEILAGLKPAVGAVYLQLQTIVNVNQNSHSGHIQWLFTRWCQGFLAVSSAILPSLTWPSLSKRFSSRCSLIFFNSISTSVAEWYKASFVRRFFGTATWVRVPPLVKGLRP